MNDLINEIKVLKQKADETEHWKRKYEEIKKEVQDFAERIQILTQHKIKLSIKSNINNRKYNTKGKFVEMVEELYVYLKTNDGSEMTFLYENKDWEKIGNHCLEDVNLVKELYLRLRSCNLC